MTPGSPGDKSKHASVLFELFLLKPATRFLEGLEAADLQEVRRLLEIISHDPFWDQRTKFPFPVPPAVVTMYDSGRFKIVYHVASSVQIKVWAIGYSGERPQIH